MYPGRGRTPRSGQSSFRGGYSNHSHSPVGDFGEKSHHTRVDGMPESQGRRIPKRSPSGSSYTKNENAPVYEYRLKSSLPAGTGFHGQNDTPEILGTPDAVLNDGCLSLSHHSSSLDSKPGLLRDQIELSSVEETESCAAPLHHAFPNKINISDSVHKSETPKLSYERSPQNSSGIYDSSQAKCQAVIEPFDICLTKIGTPVMLKPSLLVKNREKRNEIKRSTEGQIGNVLRPGMVLLKKYLSIPDQVKIVRACRSLGLGSGGFYQPGYRDGAKLHLKMMCLGKNWDPETGNYGDRQTIDSVVPAGIPREFYQLVEKAIKDSHSLIQQKTKASLAEDILPWMSPNICIVNFYSASGRLGLHQVRRFSPS
ncbi:2-oxoglutarate-dependent dioxygenase family protein, putative isoform 2 [Hibiscus syriacus]|uniref:2-oxoglutarate-dependent dioxygenase family protein, putative isoform 2 n=1 Tax=Hibiscus syriacus TaxID=106335 RepID=A0A6A2Z3Z7_HIBSY|nr:2-oxoglutarate-dependent dioxygenase family protein, putative isoform 2 [Hibiscus syriacus]